MTVATNVTAGAATGSYPSGEDPRSRTITQLWRDCSDATTLPTETPAQQPPRRQLAEQELARRLGNAARVRAILTADQGQRPRRVTSVAAEDGLNLGGHIRERHVLGSPTMPDIAALAHRVCRNQLINGSNAPCPRKAGAFSSVADADTAVANGVRTIAENWDDIRQQLVQGTTISYTASLTSRGIALERPPGPVIPANQMPPYFGGTGTRPLYPGDERMSAHAGNPPLTTFVTCSELFLRIVPHQSAPGGWYVNSAWPQ